jgi:hypothetical protein
MKMKKKRQQTTQPIADKELQRVVGGGAAGPLATTNPPVLPQPSGSTPHDD